MSENTVKTAIIDFLIRTGWIVLRINSGRDPRRHFYYSKWFADNYNPQTAGIFDIIALHLTWPPLAVDAKDTGKLNDVGDAQRKFMAEWQAHGGVALVVDSVDMLSRELEAVK